jgi:hypothetical protein
MKMAEKEGEMEIVGELKRLLQTRQESVKRYRERKNTVLDFDIRAYYDILMTACEAEEMRLTSAINKLEQ